MRQTFIQLLKIDQIKGLCFVRPDYMEPVNLNTKKKKSRRRRTPSPVEFIIEEDSEDNENTIKDWNDLSKSVFAALPLDFHLWDEDTLKDKTMKV